MKLVRENGYIEGVGNVTLHINPLEVQAVVHDPNDYSFCEMRGGQRLYFMNTVENVVRDIEEALGATK